MIQKQILTAIIDRLRNYSIKNGYSKNILRIDRSKLSSYNIVDVPAINVTVVSDIAESVNYDEEYRIAKVVIQYSDNMNPEDLNFIDNAYEVAGTIATLVFRNPSFPKVTDEVDKDLGGLVDTITVSSITPFVGMPQSEWSGVTVNFDIGYSCEIGIYL